ncbi:PqqD family protein [Pleionea sp. CnH1-48]|uniref:PqqD family protein n=1 Tax=Pleionea sp. CnH1-48 TaxID=2954494 RepID=UPI0020984185|nr:PqqD family protein [Pleionea sp. CnH1-48]MCO7227302.1 PqqD family protein [Pleionea sp. CnH1-48]
MNLKEFTSKSFQSNKQHSNCIIDGELVLLNIENGNYYSLNSTATNIWSKLDKKLSFNALCKQLQEEYDVEENQCFYDVMEILTELHRNDLVNAFEIEASN